MAPVGMVGDLSWFFSPEVGIISLVAFLVLSIILLALCANCNRSGYDVNGTSQPDGGNANGNTKTGGPDEIETSVYASWQNHKNMPPNALERAATTH